MEVLLSKSLPWRYFNRNRSHGGIFPGRHQKLVVYFRTFYPQVKFMNGFSRNNYAFEPCICSWISETGRTRCSIGSFGGNVVLKLGYWNYFANSHNRFKFAPLLDFQPDHPVVGLHQRFEAPNLEHRYTILDLTSASGLRHYFISNRTLNVLWT